MAKARESSARPIADPLDNLIETMRAVVRTAEHAMESTNREKWLNALATIASAGKTAVNRAELARSR